MPFDAPHYPSPPPKPGHHPATIVGGGLVGLTLALDLAQRGIPTILLDDDDTVSTGSRAICMAQRSLEIFARLGLGERMLAKGITWNTGRVYFKNAEIYDFDLLPDPTHQYPAFINLQQYYAEAWLIEACQATGLVDLRWRHAVTALEAHPQGATLSINTPQGPYTLTTDWLLAADGARSTIRRSMDLPFQGRTFQDRFLIADVTMQAPFPTERRFWFDPPFHPNQSALLHKQPDDIWRIDLQLGWDADPAHEQKPENVIPRIQAMLGPDIPFTLEWVSLYTFRCRRLERFVHGRVVFVGDSAHQVSPFGARGGNGGIQDADNLAWKLAAVLQGHAPEALIQTYDTERQHAADENILHSTRATDFITPKTQAAKAYRDATLRLAATHPFACPFVNSGRLSRPATLPLKPLDSDTWPGAPIPGTPALDAPLTQDGHHWLLRHLGPDFTLLDFALLGTVEAAPQAPSGQNGTALQTKPTLTTLHLPPTAANRQVIARYNVPPGAAILIRPDTHVAALFLAPTPSRIQAAIRHALNPC